MAKQDTDNYSHRSMDTPTSISPTPSSISIDTTTSSYPYTPSEKDSPASDDNHNESGIITAETASSSLSLSQVEVIVPSHPHLSKSRPVSLKDSRRSSYIKRLELSAALEREKFGLDHLHISTSPFEEDITVELPSPAFIDQKEVEISYQRDDHLHSHQIHANTRAPSDLDDHDAAKMVGSSEMSKNDTIRPPSTPSTPPPPAPSSRPAASAVNIPTSSRIRNPPPPSPLSKVSSSSPPKGPELDPQPIPPTSDSTYSTSLGSSISPPSLKGLNIPLHSPCFIHSHLDKHGHGSLQDWLKSKSTTTGSGNTSSSSTNTVGSSSTSTYRIPHTNHNHNQHHHVGNTTKPIRQPSYNASKSLSHPGSGSRSYNGTPSHSLPTSPNGTKYPSPTLGKDTGYDSDQSSVNGIGRGGSAILDGDLLDDSEEAGSLTRQLAETAQGVREMSKELGRTKVRSRIQHVLIVTKARDNRLIKLTRELALYLMLKKPATSPDGSSRPGHEGRDRGMVVYVDAQLRTSKRFDASGIQREYPDLFKPISRRRSSSSASVSTLGSLSAYPSTSNMSDFQKRNKDEGQLRYWTSEMCSSSPHLFDFVITLGGDGTVLFTSWLFQRIVPPVLPFALGSLGFLTNFDYAQFKPTMDKVVDEGIRVNLRMRFTCTVYRAIAPEEAAEAANAKGGKKRKAIKKPGGEILMSHVDKGGWESLEGGASQGSCSEAAGKDKEILCFSTRPVEQFEVLNDLVVDRGPSPYVSLLELFGDEHHLTTVQADGLTVSTPTGSTAYSLSAGGSLVHPQIPALLITPICPHTLSFRPMLLPDSMELRICVPYNSRSTAWASFDGRGRVELKQGDHIKVTASKYPFPTVCADKASTDWFSSISRTLRWNEREKQKSFVVVEEDSEPPADTKSHQRSTNKRQNFAEGRQDAEAERAAVNVEGQGKADEEDEDEDEEEDEEDEEFDIDDKSGGENTEPSSPPIEAQASRPPPPNRLNSLIGHAHKSGVETPNRFMTPYEAPPPLSQRHLVEALTKAEIREKDNEQGQRDNIREDGSAFRYNGKSGEHLIPPGRSNLTSPTENQNDIDRQSEGDETDRALYTLDQKTPRPIMTHSNSHHHNHGERVRIQSPIQHKHHHNHGHGHGANGRARNEAKGKAKAFAFFGQVSYRTIV
uniref:NAD+ kinase n=1 Tax=Kwoniella bestiolae CBS 10118 TaxID=1296100 RepID=A0A1B9FWB1_9TREE|nr:NAD+ kinase [Kwoniella bestiolae CBS 10118]OCF23041.1 NAD+ kinase [Kwoniella bestiolae CBS 10118]